MTLRRRILDEVDITEFSGVDVPAQEGADAALLKSASKENTPMSQPNTAPSTPTTPAAGGTADLQAELTKALARVTSLEQELAKAKLTPEDAAILAKAKAPVDEVVYTAADGTAIRKSMDPSGLLAKMARERDEERAAREMDACLAKAAKDMNHWPGTPAERVAILSGIAGIKDEDLRKKATALVETVNTNLGQLFKAAGRNGGPPEANSPEVQLEQLAKAYQTANKVDYATAYAAVLGTDQGAALYKAYTGN